MIFPTAKNKQETREPYPTVGDVVPGPVSHVPQFILVSTECHGYRRTGKHDPLLDKAVLPDYFEVDTLRELGRLKNHTMFQLIHISANGRFALCGERSGILKSLDICDEKHIFQTRRHWHGGLLYGDTLPEYDHTNRIPVIWPYAGSAWYDLRGEKVKIIRNDRKDCCSGQCEGITGYRGGFLQTTIRNTLRIIPAESLGKVYQEIPLGFTGVPSVCGSIIAFSHRRNGDVRVGRISGEKIFPIPERSFTGFAGFPDRVVFLHGKMIIPCGWQGLLIEK